MANVKKMSLNQLLQWSIENSDQEHLQALAEADRSGSYDHLKPIDPEILEAVFPDVASRMQELVNVLTTAEASNVTVLASALEELEYQVEDIDNANDLPKLGGLPPLVELWASHEDASVRKAAGWVLCTSLQHTPYVQERFLGEGGMATLVARLRDEPDPHALLKTVGMASALLMHPASHAPFSEHNGLAVLTALVDQAPARVGIDTADLADTDADETEDTELLLKLTHRVLFVLSKLAREFPDTLGVEIVSSDVIQRWVDVVRAARLCHSCGPARVCSDTFVRFLQAVDTVGSDQPPAALEALRALQDDVAAAAPAASSDTLGDVDTMIAHWIDRWGGSA